MAARRTTYTTAEALRIILESDSDDSDESLEDETDFIPVPQHDDTSEIEDHFTEDNEVSDVQDVISADESDRVNQEINAPVLPARGQVRGRGRGRRRGRSRGGQGRGRSEQNRSGTDEAQEDQDEFYGDFLMIC